MCMGGGGGGDGSAQQREEQRQKEQDDATARVNALFGVYDGTGVPKPDPSGYSAGYTETVNEDGTSSAVSDDGGYSQALADWEQAQSGLQGQAATAAGARNALYDDTKKSVFDNLMRQVNEQGDVAGRQASFSLARRGLTGGSADVDAHSALDKERTNAVLRIGNQADSAASNLKSSDETARLQLIDRIHGGMSADQAITSANIAQSNAAESAKSEALASSLGQVFSTYANYNNNQNMQNGYQDGFNRPPQFGTWNNANPSSFQGR